MGSEAAGSSAAERAHEFIRRAIMDGEFTAGSMLSEADLANRVGVSRTPVRAALLRLQSEGWVTIYPQRGVQVRELTAVEVREGAQVRWALECAGVRNAIPRRLEDLKLTYAANLAEQEVALTRDDFASFAQSSRRFHRAFVELADNAMMTELYDRLADRQYLTIVRSAEHVVAVPRQVLEQHKELCEHALAQDWTAFADVLARHQDDH